MLGKLIKYEFKGTARLILMMYLVVAAMTAVNAILLATSGQDGLHSNLATGVTIVLYVISLIAANVVTIAVIVVRFYRSLGDEGYLLFTLPVSTHEIILSKLATGVVWALCTLAVTIGSFIALFITQWGDIFSDFIVSLNNFFSAAGASVAPWLILIIISILISYVGMFLTFYTAMAIGPHITRNRLGGSILGFIIVIIVTNVISSVVSGMAFFSSAFGNMGTLMFDAGYTAAQDNPQVLSSISEVALSSAYVALGVSVAIYIACYILTHYMLKRMLNLA
jgi:hypothetical protein